MNENKPTIDEIIAAWKADCGEIKQSERGTTYVVVPIADRYTNFLNLIQTMIDYGYNKTEIKQTSIRNKVVLACWPDIIIRMSAKELKRSREITGKQWDEAFDKFSDLKITKFVDSKKPVSSKPSDTVPKRKVIDLVEIAEKDTSPDPELDLDFLNDLGLDESFFKASKQ